MPFTEKAPAFLFENYTRNDKVWFQENKDIYQKEIADPFAELIETVAPVLEKIDDRIICNPRKLSRIYKDARFVKGGPIFRQSVWCSLCREKEPFISKPEFYFYISSDGFGWGCGYYKTPPKVMDRIRELIISGDKTAVNAVKAYESQDRFTLFGEMYKRDRFPEQPENLKQWLNRRSICVAFDGEDPELLFSRDLPQTVKSDFEKAADIYKLFIKAEETL